MRKNHFLAAAGVMSLMLASCASDEPVASVSNAPENLISYSTGVANQSRAAHSYCANIMPENFNVWAHVDNADKTLYIGGDEINKVDDGYVAAVDRFWPEDGETLSFFAYVDAENSFKYNQTMDGVNPMFKDYTIKDDVADQLDLMYAVTKQATNKETVNLNFRHALAQVCYKAINENPNLSITINSITVAGLANKGTYTFPEESTTTNYENHAGEATDDELSRGSWELDAARNASYKVDLEDGVKLSNKVSNLTFPELDEDNSHAATDFSNVLALLPYDETATTAATVESTMTASPAEGTYFILNLTITNRAVNQEGGVEEYPLLNNKDFYVGAAFDWKQGNRYTYTFKFTEEWTPDNLTPIAYAVSVDDYINQEGVEIDNPTWIDAAGPAPVALGDKGYEGVLFREADEANGVKPLYLATKNIGAEDVEDYGRFFYFGDTEGKDIYNAEEFGTGVYVFDITNTNIPNRQWTGSDSYVNNGWVNQVEVEPLPGSGTTYRYFLKGEYDAATVNMGSCWQLPSKEDLEWLNENCKITAVEVNGIECYKIVSNTTSGTVYLPMAGYINGLRHAGSPEDEYDTDSAAFYWLNELGTTGRGLYMGVEKNKLYSSRWVQYDGMPVRGISYGPAE